MERHFQIPVFSVQIVENSIQRNSEGLAGNLLGADKEGDDILGTGSSIRIAAGIVVVTLVGMSFVWAMAVSTVAKLGGNGGGFADESGEGAGHVAFDGPPFESDSDVGIVYFPKQRAMEGEDNT